MRGWGAASLSEEELSAAKSFKLFPVFWQVFLWSWGPMWGKK